MVSISEIKAGLDAVDTLFGVVEKLPFVPTSVQHGLADVQKLLEFFDKG